MSANNPPLQIQKQLKKEASYGCVICGCPILQYAHIVPNGDVQAFLPENMLVLCPFHYIRYNDREVSESALREAKNNPYNKMHEQYAFTVISQARCERKYRKM